MNHIFHLFTIWFIIYELSWLLDFKNKISGSIKYRKLAKENEGKKWDDLSPEYKSILRNKFLKLPMVIWIFVGLLSFNWLLFLAYIIWNGIILSPLLKFASYGKFYSVIHWINTVIGLLFGLFVLINAYHLRIDLWNEFQLEFFKSQLRR